MQCSWMGRHAIDATPLHFCSIMTWVQTAQADITQTLVHRSAMLARRILAVVIFALDGSKCEQCTDSKYLVASKSCTRSVRSLLWSRVKIHGRTCESCSGANAGCVDCNTSTSCNACGSPLFLLDASTCISTCPRDITTRGSVELSSKNM